MWKFLRLWKLGCPLGCPKKHLCLGSFAQLVFGGYDNDNDNGKRAPERAKISNFQKIAWYSLENGNAWNKCLPHQWLRDYRLPKFRCFFGKSPNGLWPPPPLIFGNFIALFSQKIVNPFLDIFPKFTTKMYHFKTKKICNEIFWTENDPHPFQAFSKKTSKFGQTVVPKLRKPSETKVLFFGTS